MLLRSESVGWCLFVPLSHQDAKSLIKLVHPSPTGESDNTSLASASTVSALAHAYEGHHIGSVPVSLIPGREMCMSVTMKESLREKGEWTVFVRYAFFRWRKYEAGRPCHICILVFGCLRITCVGAGYLATHISMLVMLVQKAFSIHLLPIALQSCCSPRKR